MPRNGSGVYSKPAGTTAVPNTTIESAKYNSTIDDIAADLNLARPVVAGGTGATSKQAAIDNLFDGTTVVDDSDLLFCDPGDRTRRFRIETGAIATATLRVMTVPNSDFTITTYGGTLTGSGDAATARGVLGLGTAATVNTGTSGATLGLLNGNLTYGGSVTFSNNITIGGSVYQGDGNVNFSSGMQTAYGAALSTALDVRAVIYTGTGTDDVVMGLGHVIAVAGTVARNQSSNVYLTVGNANTYTTTSGGTQLSGIYRGRGLTSTGNTQMQRTA